MKVKELIKHFQQLDPNEDVIIFDEFSSGDEGVFVITGLSENAIRIAFEQNDEIDE